LFVFADCALAISVVSDRRLLIVWLLYIYLKIVKQIVLFNYGKLTVLFVSPSTSRNKSRCWYSIASMPRLRLAYFIYGGVSKARCAVCDIWSSTKTWALAAMFPSAF
jgi:hypothetical protein